MRSSLLERRVVIHAPHRRVGTYGAAEQQHKEQFAIIVDHPADVIKRAEEQHVELLGVVGWDGRARSTESSRQHVATATTAEHLVKPTHELSKQHAQSTWQDQQQQDAELLGLSCDLRSFGESCAQEKHQVVSCQEELGCKLATEVGRSAAEVDEIPKLSTHIGQLTSNVEAEFSEHSVVVDTSEDALVGNNLQALRDALAFEKEERNAECSDFRAQMEGTRVDLANEVNCRDAEIKVTPWSIAQDKAAQDHEGGTQPCQNDIRRLTARMEELICETWSMSRES